MSWIQVYVTGLAVSLEPSDEDIEKSLEERYSLTSDCILWAGPGTTMVKRDEEGLCRGFAFLAFYSTNGASAAINRINTHHGIEMEDDGKDLSKLPLLLRAELSNPKSGKKTPKKKEKYLPDLRLRKQRGAPVRKHPVITSSDGKRTNLGSKTK